MRPEPRREWREGTGALDQVVSNQPATPTTRQPQLYLNFTSTFPQPIYHLERVSYQWRFGTMTGRAWPYSFRIMGRSR